MDQESPSNLDKKVQAECECGRKNESSLFVTLKTDGLFVNKCKQPMKVKGNAIPPISTTDRVGYARWLSLTLPGYKRLLLTLKHATLI